MTYLSDSMMVVLPQPLAPTIMVRGRLEEIILSGKMGCRVAERKVHARRRIVRKYDDTRLKVIERIVKNSELFLSHLPELNDLLLVIGGEGANSAY